MPGIKYTMLLLLLATGVRLAAQPDSGFAVSRALSGEIVDFSVDNFGNIYTLSPDNQLKKLNAAGDSLAVYNDVRHFGRMTSMDVTNPLKILLYYRDFATIVTVDRYLNTVNTIDLRRINIFQAKSVALSYDNNIWVYDELEAKLKKIDDNGTLLMETTDVRQFSDAVPDPVSIIDQSGLVYLFDESRGVFIFDHYGAFQRLIPFTGIRDFTVIDKNLLGRDDQHFFRYTAGSLDVASQPIPAAYLPAIKILVMPNAVYVLRNDGLRVYTHP